MLRFFLFFLCLWGVFACDDVERGDAYAGRNSLQCHQENKVVSCTEVNPLVGPVGGVSNDNAIFGNGEIEEIDWETTVSWFLKSYDHLYGFDVDPLAFYPDNVERGQDVYMSVKRGELAKLRIRVDPKIKDDFHLHQIDEKKQIISSDVYQGGDICVADICLREIELSKGDYAVYYGNVDKKRYVHVIEFSKDEKNIDFVQYGDADNSNCFFGEENGCYNRDNVEESFNEVFSQAVVGGRFVERKPSDFKLDDVLYVDLTEPMNLNDYLSDVVTQIVMEKNPDMKSKYEVYQKYMVQQSAKIVQRDEKKVELNECYDKNSSKYACEPLERKIVSMNSEIQSLRKKIEAAHLSFMTVSHIDNWSVNVVLGINEMSIGWDLPSNALSGTIVLQNYSDYNNVCTKYYKLTYDEGCLNKRFPMYLVSSDPNIQQKRIEAEMVDFDKESNSFLLKLYNVGSGSGHYRYTLVADVYPIVPGFPYAVAYAAQIPGTFVNGFPRKDGPSAVVGGLVWGAHTSGQNSYNTLNHEIAHTYGMSDAYMSNDDPFIYKSTEETNLMNYATPIGPKIAYRPKQVVYTSKNERIKKNGKYATESQWLCMRDRTKCVYQ
ncbi:hypothetical protein SAMN05720468_11128 [Fibrobacter sp. UWEL]|nr:hypothetical protein SAMN05720468_11128 [Fibrobacter sp. UWEL]